MKSRPISPTPSPALPTLRTRVPGRNPISAKPAPTRPSMPSITTSLLLPGRWLLPSINSSHPTSTSRSTDRCTDSPHQVLRQSILDRLASLTLPLRGFALGHRPSERSAEQKSELQSLMPIQYAVFCCEEQTP